MYFRIAFISILLSLCFYHKAYSQDKLFASLPANKIKKHVLFVIPSGDALILEQYHNFKNNFWFFKVDTVKRVGDSIVGINFKINIKHYVTVDICDVTVNEIRNNARNHFITSKLNRITKEEVGWNWQFEDSLEQNMLTYQDERNMCHHLFMDSLNKYTSAKLELIEARKKRKEERLTFIKQNPDKIDSSYIQTFFKSFDFCSSDKESVIELMIAKTDEFLMYCKKLKEADFESILWNLKEFPEGTRIKEALHKIRKSPVTVRYRKEDLVRKLESQGR